MNRARPASGRAAGRAGAVFELVLLLVDAVVLALLEMFFLPFYVGAVAVPLTALLAAATLPLLVRRAVALFPTTAGGAAPMLAWVVVVLGVGFTGPGGDAVLIPDWTALALLALGLLPSAVVLGRALGTVERNRG